MIEAANEAFLDGLGLLIIALFICALLAILYAAFEAIARKNKK